MEHTQRRGVPPSDRGQEGSNQLEGRFHKKHIEMLLVWGEARHRGLLVGEE